MTDETLLLRQVHPLMVQDGQITSQVFRPTQKDEDKLSVYDGDMIGPQKSWEHYTNELGYKSHGVVVVTVLECSDLDLPVRPDPQPFPEHAIIDYSESSQRAQYSKAKLLKRRAIVRGWQYVSD